MTEEKIEELIGKLPKFKHRIIRDTISEGQAGAGQKVMVLRCDSHPYQTVEYVVPVKEIREMLFTLLRSEKEC